LLSSLRAIIWVGKSCILTTTHFSSFSTTPFRGRRDFVFIFAGGFLASSLLRCEGYTGPDGARILCLFQEAGCCHVLTMKRGLLPVWGSLRATSRILYLSGSASFLLASGLVWLGDSGCRGSNSLSVGFRSGALTLLVSFGGSGFWGLLGKLNTGGLHSRDLPRVHVGGRCCFRSCLFSDDVRWLKLRS